MRMWSLLVFGACEVSVARLPSLSFSFSQVDAKISTVLFYIETDGPFPHDVLTPQKMCELLKNHAPNTYASLEASITQESYNNYTMERRAVLFRVKTV